MPILTLTTEWNNNDYYSGAVKGAIYSICPEVTILEISNQITPYNYFQAAFIIRNCYKNFPEGTIHIIGVKSESKSKNPYLAVKFNNQYFLVANNGIINLISGDKSKTTISIDIFGQYSTFPELNIFAKAACHLFQGKDIVQLGEELKSLEKQMAFLPAYDESVITGAIVYIDSYKNGITNISQNLFTQIGRNRPFEIFIQSSYNKTKVISKKYSDVSEGDLVTLFNSLGLLEVAMYNAPLCQLLNLEINSNVRVKFR